MEEQPLVSLRIADMNSDDRPREKALTQGIRSLSDAELIAIIFGGGLPGLSVVEMARGIMHACDNRMDRVAAMSMNEMMSKFKGVGPAKAVSLAAAFELGRRNRESMAANVDPLIRQSRDVVEMMQPLVAHLEYEEFWVLMLSRANRVTRRLCLSQGGTAATVVDVKLLMKRAVDCLASGIILVHNHPSGNPVPSGQDDGLTRKIKEGGAILDIRVLDHIIIARDKFYSYLDEGRL